MPSDAEPGKDEIAGQSVPFPLSPAGQDLDNREKLAKEYFGSQEIGREVLFKLALARRMHRGSKARSRPAVRRDKLEATAKVIRKLLTSLGTFDVQTVANALGRIEPTDFTRNSDGLQIARPMPSQSPILLQEYGKTLRTLRILEAGFDTLAESQRGVRRGAANAPRNMLDVATVSDRALIGLWAVFGEMRD